MIWARLDSAAFASSAAGNTGFHFDLGDVPTWLLAAFALGALIAAGLAYNAQHTALTDQRSATAELARQATALADQAELQRNALADQQAVNALQARALEKELSALTRRQAEQIDVEHETYDGTQVDSLTSPSGVFWLVKLRNDSPRPVRNIACRLPAEYEDAAVKAAWFEPIPTGPSFGLIDDEVIPLLASGETWGFVVAIPLETSLHAPGPTVRFTDDAGLHWQVTADKSIVSIDERDW